MHVQQILIMYPGFSVPILCVVFVISGILLFLVKKHYDMQKERRIFSTLNGVNLIEKVAIVTGATGGLGKATCLKLCEMGVKVIMACRDIEKAKLVKISIQNYVPCAKIDIKFIKLDDLDTIKTFCHEVSLSEEKIDILINNAAVAGLAQRFTEAGLDYTFASNHLGHFLLTSLLKKQLERSGDARVVIVSSNMYMIGSIVFDSNDQLKHSDGWKQYANTKLMNCMFAIELHKRWSGKNMGVFALTPGVVYTDLMTYSMKNCLVYDWLNRLFIICAKNLFKSAEDGCMTAVYCATAPNLQSKSGCYFKQCCDIGFSGNALNSHLAEKLWSYCELNVKNYL